MQINITAPHLEVTDALREFTVNKLDRLQRHFDHIMSINITLDVEKRRQTAEGTIYIPGDTVHASAESEDLYAAINTLIDKLDRQLKEHKERRSDH